MLYRQIFIKAAQEAEAWIRRLCEHEYFVVLFGSRARGEARIDSDWDLLVIGEEPPFEPPHDLVQMVFLRPNEVEVEIERFNTLVIDALYEGKLICGSEELFRRWREVVLKRVMEYVKTREGWFKRI